MVFSPTKKKKILVRGIKFLRMYHVFSIKTWKAPTEPGGNNNSSILQREDPSGVNHAPQFFSFVVEIKHLSTMG